MRKLITSLTLLFISHANASFGSGEILLPSGNFGTGIDSGPSNNGPFDIFDGIHIDPSFGNDSYNNYNDFRGVLEGIDNTLIDDTFIHACTLNPKLCLPDTGYPFRRIGKDNIISTKLGVLQLVIEGKDPTYACNAKLLEDNPNLYHRLSNEMGSFLPTDDPIISLKEMIDNGEDIYASNKVKPPQSTTPALLADVGKCQNEGKLKCMTLLAKSLKNPEQSKYKSQCNTSITNDFKSFLKDPNDRKKISCQNSHIMAEDIILTLDGHPEGKLFHIPVPKLISMLEKVNPSAHHAVKCLSNNFKVNLKMSGVDLKKGTRVGNFSGIIYGSEYDPTAGKKPSGTPTTEGTGGSYAEIGINAVLKGVEASIEHKKIEIEKQKIEQKNRELGIRERELAHRNALLALEYAKLAERDKERKDNEKREKIKRYNDGYYVDLDGDGRDEVRKGYDGYGNKNNDNGNNIDSSNVVHVPSYLKFNQDLVNILKFQNTYHFAQGAAEEICENVYEGYEGLNLDAQIPGYIELDEDFWTNLAEAKLPTKWDKGESINFEYSSIESMGLTNTNADFCRVANIEGGNIL